MPTTAERNREYARSYRLRHPDRARASCNRWHKKNQYWKSPQKTAYRQKYMASYRAIPENAEKMRQYQHDYYRSHKEQRRATSKAWKQRMRTDPHRRIKYLLLGARLRCKTAGIKFDNRLFAFFAEHPAPRKCPSCKEALDYSSKATRDRRRRSPSIDRLIPARGYALNNVIVICCRCNIVKSDATTAELRCVLRYTERECQKRRH